MHLYRRSPDPCPSSDEPARVRTRADRGGRGWILALLGLCTVLALQPYPAAAQITGTVLGRIIDAESGQPLTGATIRVVDLNLGSLSGEDGRFVIAAVPVGRHRLRVELLGYQTVTVQDVQVRAGRQTETAPVELAPSAVQVEGVVVEADRIRLVEPDVTVSHEVVVGRELRELPIDAVEEALELAAGVSEGHFRGGRVGQEVYVVDGIELKNQLEASSQGFGLEFAPSALEEIEVVTGGFGAEYGSALSGVVRFTTRRGNPERWEGRAAMLTDHWAPDAVFRGFGSLSASAGGPAPLLGSGTTIFLDVLAQGFLDAEPRARGLSCIRPEDTDDDLADVIRGFEASSSTRHLVCPHTPRILPHQQGDKLIAFARVDRPLAEGLNLSFSLLRNRLQRQLYTSEFKYNADGQLGQRVVGTLGLLTLDWSRSGAGRAVHVTGRVVGMRLDRHLGALDPASLEDRLTVGGFGLGSFRFLGEDFVRRPIQEQLAGGGAVPGYEAPGGAVGSPFGPAGEGLFFTTGTPHLANWSRSDLVGGDLIGELISPRGNGVRAGVATKFYAVEQYERALAHLAGSTPNYARFYPGTVNGFVEARLAAADEITVQLGARIEAFRPGLTFRTDRGDFLLPVVETGWQTSVMPRFAVAGPIPVGDRLTAFRFSYGLVAQPPDFRFFLDTTVGDSLRTDIRRQGNPELSFERGAAWEVGFERLLADGFAVGVTGFQKELTNLVTGSIDFSGGPSGQFSTGDFGMVRGLEVAARGQWQFARFRVGYALQRATGVASGALEDTIIGSPSERREFPLAFDRRHSISGALWIGAPAGAADSPWSGSVSGWARSGHPLDRVLAGGDVGDDPQTGPVYLPWTSQLGLRLSREIGQVPGCGSCVWRVIVDGRNVFGSENVLALRRDSGTVAPPLDLLMEQVGPGITEPIPFESPAYSALTDLDGNGIITPEEYRTARIAALLDRYDPTLYFGEPRQIRLGVEVSFP